MPNPPLETPNRSVNRRRAIQSTFAAGILPAAISAKAYAAGTDRIKIGLIGCGGRGTGAAAHSLSTGQPAVLWAMADAFEDRLTLSLNSLMRGRAGQSRVEKGQGFGEGINVPPERQFVGLDGYRKLMDSDVDLVILTGPPGYRPLHFEYAVNAGKHVFMEKPLATDPPGVRRILAAAEKAREKGLKVGVGLQRHHQDIYLEAIKRIHAGEIGHITSMRCFWNTGFPAKTALPREDMTELQYQVRNWYFFDWLSGDHICEQHIHNLDICNWAFGDHPVLAEGMGGRQVRTDKKYGNIFDHHAVNFQYADGTVLHSYCRQIPGCSKQVAEQVVGSEGVAEMSTTRCALKSGDKVIWESPRRRGKDYLSPYQVEWNDLMDAIAKDQPYGEADYGATSTMTAILGRFATYSGKEIAWDDAFNSNRVQTTDAESWDAEAPISPNEDGGYEIAMPGSTKVL